MPGSAGISPDFCLSQELGQRLTGAQQLKRQQTQQLLRHVQSEDRQTPIASMISYEKYSLKIVNRKIKTNLKKKRDFGKMPRYFDENYETHSDDDVYNDRNL